MNVPEEAIDRGPDDSRAGGVRARIRADLSPVRPLRAPWRRALAVFVPWAAVALAFVLGVFGVRGDLVALRPLLGWGVSLAFLVAGAALLIALVRESIPGRRAPAALLALGVAVAIAARVLAAFATDARHPCPTPVGDEVRLAFVCSSLVAILALPLLVAGVRMVRRGLPASPWTAALLAGAASGLAAEALWRFHCPFTDPAHIVSGHLPPVVVAAAAALALARR